MPLVGSIDTAKKLQIFRQYFVKKDKGLPKEALVVSK
tara:strand:+ start:739 stop:849 length:111 start_codon:yes stop_codon:yes gene_type:complete